MGFIVEAEGRHPLLHLPPPGPAERHGLLPPWDQSQPLWVFTLVSTLGRIPGTWILSVQGAQTAAGNYLQVIPLSPSRWRWPCRSTTIGPGSSVSFEAVRRRTNRAKGPERSRAPYTAPCRGSQLSWNPRSSAAAGSDVMENISGWRMVL